jgi:hypothetical protein
MDIVSRRHNPGGFDQLPIGPPGAIRKNIKSVFVSQSGLLLKDCADPQAKTSLTIGIINTHRLGTSAVLDGKGATRPL